VPAIGVKNQIELLIEPDDRLTAETEQDAMLQNICKTADRKCSL